MEKIIVNASKSYNIFIGKNIIENLKVELTKYQNVKFLIITDDNVWNIYKDFIDKFFVDFDFDVFVIENGEKSKSLEVYAKIVEFMQDKYYSREDKIIAFGGGVVGDLSGFIASTYMRGMDYIQVPTTLLACVDSSVGGKTAINFSNTKNILGAFKQPELVFCELNFLNTLNDNVFDEGIAEIIKYAILFDLDLLNSLSNEKLEKNDKRLAQIVKKSIEYKALIVENDEFDSGERKKLNLGHTVAHAIEKISDNKISHGFAVGVGLHFIAKLSNKLGYLTDKNMKLIEKTLLTNCFNININFSSKEIYLESINDKKRYSNFIEIILIEDIERCIIKKATLEEWKNYINIVID